MSRDDSSMMEDELPPSEREAVAGLLAAERGRTAALVASLTRDLDEIVAGSEAANLDDEHDPEGATVGFERAQVTALLSQARAYLADLDDAMSRVRTAGFGTCAGCGKRIPIERLTARPAARTCVACAGVGRRRS